MVGDAGSLVDIHSHLVPGVDDGARHLPGALSAIERMTHHGIRRLVTTPHLRASLAGIPGRLDERLDEVTAAYELTREAVREEFPDVEYLRGHEVLIDVPEPDVSDERMRLAGTSFVLVEWPRLQVPPGTDRVVRFIRENGYRPIIAHPERYMGMQQRSELPFKWKEAGARLQVNYGSLVGRYGSEAQTVAWRLLGQGLVDYLASDFHGQSRLKIYKREAWAEIHERGGDEALDLLCRVNPARVLEDAEPLPVPAISPPSVLLQRLRGIMVRRDRAVERQP